MADCESSAESSRGELRLYRRESAPSAILQASLEDPKKASWEVRVLGGERTMSSSTLALILLGEWSVQPPAEEKKIVAAPAPTSWFCCSCFYPEDEDEICRTVGLAGSSVADVTLNVYSVGTTKSVKRINQVTSQFGGLFHVGVQVYGREWSFASGTGEGCCGIVSCSPTECPLHIFRESVYLGDCGLSRLEVGKVLQGMRDDWQGASYDLLHKNCCSFANSFVKAIGISQGIPKRVDRFARIAASLDVKAQTAYLRLSSVESLVAAKVGRVFRARKRRRRVAAEVSG